VEEENPINQVHLEYRGSKVPWYRVTEYLATRFNIKVSCSQSTLLPVLIARYLAIE